MTTESEVSTGAETENQAPEVVENPEVTTPEVEAEKPAEETPPEEDPREKALKAMQRRIDKRTRDLYAERAERQRLEQQIASRQTDDPAETPRVDVEALAVQKAEQIANQRELQRRVADVIAKGNALPDFSAHCNAAIEELSLLDSKGQPTPMLSVFLEADSPHEVLDHIGKNPEVAALFDGLTPTQAARRLVKLEAELAQAKAPKVSTAPKPIKPVAGGPAGEPDPSAMTDKQFAAWRKQQIAARRA